MADDVSDGVAEKILCKAQGREVRSLSFSSKAALGQLLGRGERSVTALVKGRLAETFLAEWQKYRDISGDN
jgi:ribosomal protein L7Ae-like RNA K-turn-binding protein